MLIRSDQGTIEIVRGSFDDPWDFDASIESRGFSAHVSNIFPMNTGDFFQQIRAIESRNQGHAVLKGTEDFELLLELPVGSGAFWVEVRVFAGFDRGRPALRSLTCRLHVDGEYWFSTVTGLRAELVGVPGAGV